MDTNKIYITGAGPGIPDLLTIKAFRVIKSAEVILYDAIATNELLKLAIPECITIDVGKLFNDGQDQTKRQDRIHSLMAKYYKEGKRVVRLKSGDPFVFGRGMEEVRYLLNKQIPWEVIPGITAANAASCKFTIPLTERGKSRMILFVSGYTKEKKFTETKSMSAVLTAGGTVCLYMALSRLNNIIRFLTENHLEETIKIIIANDICGKDEKAIYGTYKDITEKLKRQNIKGPAVILLGKHI